MSTSRSLLAAEEFQSDDMIYKETVAPASSDNSWKVVVEIKFKNERTNDNY